jgi:hypothetical protein
MKIVEEARQNQGKALLRCVQEERATTQGKGR